MAKKKPLIVMVSSTVYGVEELLERIYAILTRFGYEVWMSHKGTVPVISTKSAFPTLTLRPLHLPANPHEC